MVIQFADVEYNEWPASRGNGKPMQLAKVNENSQHGGRPLQHFKMSCISAFCPAHNRYRVDMFSSWLEVSQEKAVERN